MIWRYLKEYLAICEYLEKSGCRQKKGCFQIERRRMEELLDRNRYETAAAKLKVWKALRWIDAEERRLTKRIYDKEAGAYITCVEIPLQVYQTMKLLVENSGN